MEGKRGIEERNGVAAQEMGLLGFLGLDVVFYIIVINSKSYSGRTFGSAQDPTLTSLLFGL